MNHTDRMTAPEVAQQAWRIPDHTLGRLLTGGHGSSPETRDDVRSQFAMWASTQPARTFDSLAQAWNDFVAPKAGMRTPVALIPGATCHECSRIRHRIKDFTKPGYANCRVCRGTGRKPPQAIPALMAHEEDFAYSPGTEIAL